jgi:phosphoglycolate phosphatase
VGARAAGRSLRAVLFDWDGTLLDSAEASFNCYVRLFAAFAIPFDRGTFRRTYSPDWRRTYEALGLPRERWAEADARWLELYREQRADLIPGARESLQRLAALGLTCGLVTSGDGSRVRGEVAALGLGELLGVLVCGEDSPHRKPHPAPLRMALDSLGVPPSRAAYVGDSPEDVEMARAAGALSVAIPGGFPNREALAASRPDLMATELRSAVALLTEPGPESRAGL